MAARIEFGLLGPLVVRADEAVVSVQRGSQRALLAILLLRAGRVVKHDDLTEVLWGAHPPPSAAVTARNLVKRLRHTLGDASRERVRTVPGGYFMHVQPDELDVHRFEALLESARAAARAGDWGAAADSARSSLALWRGEPLADVDSHLLAQRDIPRLRELRLQAFETLIDAGLEIGAYPETIAELRRLVPANPFRERLHAQLMMALYRDGRQAEALAAYQQARHLLIEELGAEPGAALRDLHRQILADDEQLTLSARPPQRPADPAFAAPQQLPPRIRDFTGRTLEAAALTEMLDKTRTGGAGTLMIAAVVGTAGVGKTALAVQWAYQVRDRFPDGQLYINLRGYDPGTPVTTTEALASFLRGLGVPGGNIPAEADERASLYRSLLAGRKILVVLDNASDPDHVRPLLPGSPACAVVVTSRDSLAGLVARDGARRLDLGTLQPADAVELLRRLIGNRVDAHLDAASSLARLCVRLPLALRIAAELATARPDVSLTDLLDELSDQHRRLDLLDAGGDDRTAVRAVLSWSYQHLGRDTAPVFRILTLHPGLDFDRYAAAALVDRTVEQTSRLLDRLVRANLIQPAGSDRYGMHDLLRVYAEELSASQDSRADKRQARTRLFDHFLQTAAAAMTVLFPAEGHRRPEVPAATGPVSPLSDRRAAQTWLDTELASLVMVSAWATGDDPIRNAAALAATLSRYLDAGGHYSAAIEIHGNACAAARQSGDLDAEAVALIGQGLAHFRQGRYQTAARKLRQALSISLETGGLASQARALSNLGLVTFQLGRTDDATEHLRRALAIHQIRADPIGQAGVLANLAEMEQRRGDLRHASGYLHQARALSRKSGDRAGQARALGNIGLLRLRQDMPQQAAGFFQQALSLYQLTGDRSGEACNLANLGRAHRRLRNYEQAIVFYRRALTFFREAGDRSSEADALNGLGAVLHDTGKSAEARSHFDKALSLAREIGDRDQQARARCGLADCHRAAGQLGDAIRHWHEALALYVSLGAPEADHVRGQLSAVMEVHGQNGARPYEPEALPG